MDGSGIGYCSDKTDYYAHRIGPERKTRSRIRRLESLGYRVILEPAA
ncbi:hypothetical protein AB0J63_20830 [Streptosporangium canum]